MSINEMVWKKCQYEDRDPFHIGDEPDLRLVDPLFQIKPSPSGELGLTIYVKYLRTKEQVSIYIK